MVDEDNGNQATCTTLVVVNPPACGNDGNKVIICHKGKTICISKDAVQAHLNHGDHWGACNGSATMMEFADDDKPGKHLQVKVYVVRSGVQVATERIIIQ
ncbi:hypothetical protein [Chitinophaga polysaccharea]|uniref:hypothetical protein n=1 Tax=Chitinophaga polysaccharea TaxID=1293035 RepID=UPI001159E0B1|nr:hypothetical protein [Chitinophaga polysaccharea]